MTAPFPACFADLIADRIVANNIAPAELIVKNELASTNSNGTIAIEVADWNPTDAEIGISERNGLYTVFVSTMTKNSNRDEGRATSSVLAKTLRAMLARDPELHVQLAQLSETVFGETERVRRGRVKMQKYLGGDIKGIFTFITLTQFDIDTEVF